MAWHPDTASLLIQRKREMKSMCQGSSQRHIQRLSQGVSDSIASSSGHLDLISELRWISTQIASIGYDILPDETSETETEERLIGHSE